MDRTDPKGVTWGRQRAHWITAVAMAIASMLVLAPLARAEDSTTGTVQVLVRVDVGTDVSALAAAHGGTVDEFMSSLSTAKITVPVGSVETLSTATGVLELTPDAELHLVSSDAPRPTASDVASGATNPGRFVEGDFGDDDRGPSFDSLGLLELAKVINADDAADAGIDGTGVDIALIDTGIAPVPGLTRVVNGPDLSFQSQDPELRHLDTNGHGTHLAGIISGLAPDSRLLNVKVGSYDGATDVSQVLAAIDWVVQHRNDNGLNVRVINLAYGTQNTQDWEVDPLAHAVDVAWRHGIVVVTAAGNGGTEAGRLTNPAINPRVLAVGASEAHGTYVTSDDTVAKFSSRGDASRGVDVVAPGRSVVSLRNPGSFIDSLHPEGRVGEALFRGSGTSQSAAVVSAAAALLLEDEPGITPDQVKAQLLGTAKSLPRATSGQGSGIIDVRKAIKTPVPSAEAAAQSLPATSGTGSLEGARGNSHVEIDGVVLQGELDIFGTSWSGTSWSGTSWSGTSWSGGTWNGTSWSGTSWSGTSWSGTSWSGTSWSGTSWSGTSWSGTSWSGTSWSGTSWS